MHLPNSTLQTPTTPVILLVRPQLGENIGAVARAMANFGLSELRLVAPRDGWPNQRAIDVSSGAGHIIEAARVYADFASATADLQLLYACTARPRDMEKRVMTPSEAVEEIAAAAQRIAFVFGPERTGLENDEIAQCDTVVTIPTSPDFSSLNLAQSVVVVGYELFQQVSGVRRQASGNNDISPETRSPKPEALATKADWHGLFGQLEDYLNEVNYYRVAHKKPIMWQNLQTMLMRGRWSAQEIQSFRGMLRSLWERERKRR